MDHGQFYSALGLAWVLCCAAIVLVAWLIRNRSQTVGHRLERLVDHAPIPALGL